MPASAGGESEEEERCSGKMQNANASCFAGLRSWFSALRKCSCVCNSSSTSTSCGANVRSLSCVKRRRGSNRSSTSSQSRKDSILPAVLMEGAERDALTGLTPYESVMVAATAAKTGCAMANRSRTPSIQVFSCGPDDALPCDSPCEHHAQTVVMATDECTGSSIATARVSHGTLALRNSEHPIKNSSSLLVLNDYSLRKANSSRSLFANEDDWCKTRKKPNSKSSHNLSIKTILKPRSSKRKQSDHKARGSLETGTGACYTPPVILISSSNFDESNPHSGKNVQGGLVLHNCQRRESFLYKSDSEYSQSPSISRHSSIATEGEDYIVTPFAQILATLKNVRLSYVAITNLNMPSKTSRKQSQHSMNSQATTSVKQQDVLHKISSDESFAKVVGETLEELDWCLEQLESLQTQRSVSELASNKFKRLLNKELSLFEEHTAAGTQISKYICNTFLDKNTELDLQLHGNKQTANEANNGAGASSGGNESSSGGDEHTNTNANCNSAGAQPQESTRINVAELNTVDKQLIAASKAGINSVSHIDGSTERALLTLNRPISAVKKIAEDSMAMTLTTTPTTPTPTAHRAPLGRLASDSPSVQRLGVETADHEQLSAVLDETLDKWGMDMFEVARLSGNRPLTVMLYTIFERRGFMSTFKIDPMILINCATLVEFNYHDVPYHNRVHGADVTQSINVLLSGPTLANVFTELEQMAALFAGAIHDVDHPGFTNQFLINSGNELAIMYNDESVLENHHLAVAFKVLQNAASDPFRNLGSKQRQTFRRMVIDMVLATDMQKHMKLLADLKTMVETKRVSGGGIVLLDNYTDRIQILQNLMHCADLANPTKPLPTYLRWVDCIMEEFWRQGDTERERKLEISPMCDRYSANVDKSQMSFIDFIVHPLWETWCELVYPDAQEILDMLDENREWYQKKSQANSQSQSLSQSQTASSHSGHHQHQTSTQATSP